MFGSYRIDKPRHAELPAAANDAYDVLLIDGIARPTQRGFELRR